ncbi:caffeine-induced death protein Cid2 [Myriangium duriaei CBS 260.36]|uniref:Caffeine-induced death protein Cid2 n=1 Tax=Myriangium duriaei CBS 260.36 TaxID=1168546 RepID=A0A9P4JBM1_9PEZI|nr:caffeine-induced death protein Cid2 [Myriangium duriaei CBS 260.36]
MASSTQRPGLSPALCFNETALRDFLRISRSTVDDTISQNLNSLLAPSIDKFDPSTTSSRQAGPRARRLIPSDSCKSFRNKVLFPSWQARKDVMTYCAGVATSPDPDDPEHLLREIEDAKARDRVVDERLDPYSGRYFPREPRTERLAGLMRNERMVEEIVRRRTWQIMGERCEDALGGVGGAPWEIAFEQWQKANSKT